MRRRELERQHARQLERLFAVIERQNDRIMQLAGTRFEAGYPDVDEAVALEQVRWSFTPEHDPEEQ